MGLHDGWNHAYFGRQSLMRRVLFAMALCVASPACAQSALEFAAAGMGQSQNYRASNSVKMSKRFARRLIRSEFMLAGVYAPLADKAREIEAACGSRVISGVRPGARVAGTRRMSLHARGDAVDLQGNASCMYRLVRNWPGGVSVDYHRAGHLHLSLDRYGVREMHARFNHGGRRTRFAWR